MVNLSLQNSYRFLCSKKKEEEEEEENIEEVRKKNRVCLFKFIYKIKKDKTRGAMVVLGIFFKRSLRNLN